MASVLILLLMTEGVFSAPLSSRFDGLERPNVGEIGPRESAADFDGRASEQKFTNDATSRSDLINQILVRNCRDVLDDAGVANSSTSLLKPSPKDSTTRVVDWIPWVTVAVILVGGLAIAGVIWLCIRLERRRKQKRTKKTTRETVIHGSGRKFSGSNRSPNGYISLGRRSSLEDVSGDVTDRYQAWPSVNPGLWAQKTIVDAVSTKSPAAESTASKSASKASKSVAAPVKNAAASLAAAKSAASLATAKSVKQESPVKRPEHGVKSMVSAKQTAERSTTSRPPPPPSRKLAKHPTERQSPTKRTSATVEVSVPSKSVTLAMVKHELASIVLENERAKKREHAASEPRHPPPPSTSSSDIGDHS